jgi:predicted glycogen debranching enzyme
MRRTAGVTDTDNLHEPTRPESATMKPMIRLSEQVLKEWGMAGTKEWLETNGRGSFASSTVEGMNTRRYHGLLVAALPPPIGRAVLLAKCDETLILNGQRHELGCNQYPGTVHPRGFLYLQEFRLDPFPTFLYRAGGTTLEKRIVMLHGRDAVVLLYTAHGLPEGARLDLAPLLAYRGYHTLTQENPFLNGQAAFGQGWVRFEPYAGMPPLYLCCEVAPAMSQPRQVGQPAALRAEYQPTGYWYHQLEYLRELERGLDFREDLFNPGLLRFALREGETVAVIAATAPMEGARWRELVAAEAARRRSVACTVAGYGEAATQLALASDQFLIRKDARPGAAASGAGHSIIAGYPWFTDWGRDTMIALPGLTLSTGRTEVARSVLRTFAEAASRGMIPNRFPDTAEEPEYNTVDATLWMFVAAWRYLQATADLAFARETLFPFFQDVIAWHRKGTRYGIHVTEDGLLTAGEPGVQLTWMDAKVGDWVVTPRQGKAVEINALWYNALRIAAEVARRIADRGSQTMEGAGNGKKSRSRSPAPHLDLAREWDELAESCRRSFRLRFWSCAHGYLADVVDGQDLEADFALRPNQLLAISLPYPLLEGEEARRILDAVTSNLLTPYGLRTLDPHDPRYTPRYAGNQWQRDAAYHQGTVWPWLMGPYLDALLRVKGYTEEAKGEARELLQPLLDHLGDAGLGSLSEIFDGDPPHTPQGCIAQAWSVAEVLRLWLETAPAPFKALNSGGAETRRTAEVVKG